MLLKKIILTHLFPLIIAFTFAFLFITSKPKKIESLNYSVTSFTNIKATDRFYFNDLNHQFAFSYALKRRYPVVLGSSELSSNHLSGLPSHFFKNQNVFSLGHAGFQTFAIMTALAANKPLIKDSKILIILSPGWFEKQYCSGTSLASFFEFCPTSYLFQIYKDSTIDSSTKNHINNYVRKNYDKISSPNALHRLIGRKQLLKNNQFVNYPFNILDEIDINYQSKTNLNFNSQKLILNTLSQLKAKPYYFKTPEVNWDSLNNESKKEFKIISNNNTIAVENNYYNEWLKNKNKKNMYHVANENNQEYKDFLALIHFLKMSNCQPIFVIMPLNTKAHNNLKILNPTINSINLVLKNNNFKSYDMFTPNVNNYEDGILEDLMHPYNTGWYKINKFIIDNFNDDKN